METVTVDVPIDLKVSSMPGRPSVATLVRGVDGAVAGDRVDALAPSRDAVCAPMAGPEASKPQLAWSPVSRRDSDSLPPTLTAHTGALSSLLMVDTASSMLLPVRSKVLL